MGLTCLFVFFRIGRYAPVSLYIRDETALSSVDVMWQVGEIRTKWRWGGWLFKGL